MTEEQEILKQLDALYEKATAYLAAHGPLVHECVRRGKIRKIVEKTEEKIRLLSSEFGSYQLRMSLDSEIDLQNKLLSFADRLQKIAFELKAEICWTV